MRRSTLKKKSAKSGGGRPGYTRNPSGYYIKNKPGVTGASGHPAYLNAMHRRNQGLQYTTARNTRRRNNMLRNAAQRVIASTSLRTNAFREPGVRNARPELLEPILPLNRR